MAAFRTSQHRSLGFARIELMERRLLMDVTFNINTTAGQHPISPYVYGTNYGQATDFTGYTFSRVGGNRWTAYNWANNASNAGSDWYYSNDNYLGGGNTPGGAVASIIVDAGNHNAPLLLTIPMAGYVSADKNGNVDITDPNRFTTRFVPSVARKDGPFTLNPPPTGTIYQDEFVNWVKQTYPATQTDPDRPVWYSLDNEPDLWASTHPEVHPAKPTYAEIIQKTIAYASAIKDVSNISLVFGPVNYGWNGMMTFQDAPDRSIAGGLNFQQYYLQQIRNAEIAAGRKLVDVDDIHYYSEAQDANGRRITGNTTDAVATAARVQAARSLYDPAYTETSWITQWSTGGPIDLIHRFQGYIDTYNPGTKLAITEYNFGAGGHISGGIAQAEALGAFGQTGLFAATYWQLSSNPSYVVSAFNMFRNFNGAGAAFGDTSTSATTTDMNQSAIFASVDSTNPNRIVLVALNRTPNALTGHFGLTIPGSISSGQWYTLTGASPAIQAMGSIPLNSAASFDLTLPAYSVNTIELSLGTAGPLTIIGDDNPNTISITRSGDQYVITKDGVTSFADVSSVSAINIEARGGNDTITIGTGVMACSILGQTGDDTITAGDFNDTVYGGDGNDSIRAGAGDDILYGNFGNDTVAGQDGHDSIMGGLDLDTLFGGTGNDTIQGGDGRDALFGDEGQDSLLGKGKADTIYGGADNDTIIGGAGADLVYAEDGDDRIETADVFNITGTPDAFPDTVYGGIGTDTLLRDDRDTWSEVENLLT